MRNTYKNGREMTDQPDDADTGDVLIEARERLTTENPGLRLSFEQFLKKWTHYLETFEGSPQARRRRTTSTTKFLR